jgi:hypothetical protein
MATISVRQARTKEQALALIADMNPQEAFLRWANYYELGEDFADLILSVLDELNDAAREE